MFQQKINTFPTLSEHTFLRYFTFSILYVAQGIPEGLLWYVIPAWLAMNGKSPTKIGSYVAIIGLPWSFKIINAPLWIDLHIWQWEGKDLGFYLGNWV